MLGDLGDPRVVNEGQRLLAAWQKDPTAIPGSLKESWLRVVARNATPATWDTLHRIAAGTHGTVERTTLYQLLGEARNEVLARRALALALTSEPGTTISAGMIKAASAKHPAMTLDFVLGHLAQVNRLIDLSGRSGSSASLSRRAAIRRWCRSCWPMRMPIFAPRIAVRSSKPWDASAGKPRTGHASTTSWSAGLEVTRRWLWLNTARSAAILLFCPIRPMLAPLLVAN